MTAKASSRLRSQATALILMTAASAAASADDRGGIVLPPDPAVIHTLVASLEGDFAGLPPQEDPQFGHSVALHGDTLAVGAPGTRTDNGDAVLERGAVFVYRRHPQNQSWQFLQRIAFGSGGNGHCGHAVALNDFSLIVGCPDHEVSGQPRGRAVIYSRDGAGNYANPQVFVDASVQTGARCGASVALIDAAPDAASVLPMAAVGCPNRRDFPGGNVGLVGGVDIYHNLLGTWLPSTSLTGPSTSNTGFGQSVSLNRAGPSPEMTMLLAVGAPGTGNSNGSVRVFAMGANVGTWAQEHQINGTVAGSRFGHSVHMRAGRLVIGAPERTVPNPLTNPPMQPTATGSVTIASRVCTFMGTCSWSNIVDEIVAPLVPVPVNTPQNRFGHAVNALTPTRVIAGAPLFPFGGFNGQARHYELDGGDWVLNEDEPFYPTGPVLPTAEFGAAVSGDASWLAIGAPGYPQAHPGRVYVYAYDYDDTIFAHDFECNPCLR